MSVCAVYVTVVYVRVCPWQRVEGNAACPPLHSAYSLETWSLSEPEIPPFGEAGSQQAPVVLLPRPSRGLGLQVHWRPRLVC